MKTWSDIWVTDTYHIYIKKLDKSKKKLASYGTDGRLFTSDVSAKFKVT